MFRVTLLLWLWLSSSTWIWVPAQPSSRTVQLVEGWTVHVDDRLLSGPDAVVGRRALALLTARLAEVSAVVAAPRVQELRAVSIVLDLQCGALSNMQYHPSPDWLTEHGYPRDLVRCVHLPVAAQFINARHQHEQPWCLLHELAHAWHHQVVSFDEPRVLHAWERYKASGHGEKVLHISGRPQRHYALTDAKEFFAEMTEAYFGMNDFFPFNHAELQQAEPEVFALMLELWGTVADPKD